MNFFVLDRFGLRPIQMDEPCPSFGSSAMSFWWPCFVLFSCQFLFGILTGEIQGI